MTKDDILALLKPTKPEVRAITLPDGNKIHVRRIGLDEKDRWEDASRDAKTNRYNADWRAKFLVMCICDEEGKRLFDDNDWPLLKSASNCFAEMVFDEAYIWSCGSAGQLALLKND